MCSSSLAEAHSHVWKSWLLSDKQDSRGGRGTPKLFSPGTRAQACLPQNISTGFAAGRRRVLGDPEGQSWGQHRRLCLYQTRVERGRVHVWQPPSGEPSATLAAWPGLLSRWELDRPCLWVEKPRLVHGCWGFKNGTGEVPGSSPRGHCLGAAESRGGQGAGAFGPDGCRGPGRGPCGPICRSLVFLFTPLPSYWFRVLAAWAKALRVHTDMWTRQASGYRQFPWLPVSGVQRKVPTLSCL